MLIRHPDSAGIPLEVLYPYGVIPYSLWSEIMCQLADFKVWEGVIHFVRVKITREGNPLGGSSIIKYQVKGRRAPVFDIRTTASEALEHCEALIREAHKDGR